MQSQLLLLLTLLLPLSQAAETILGLYIFSRHGDRTAKALAPTSLTDLGYSEVFQSGTWFRDNYIADGAPSQIDGISPNTVKLKQLSISTALDNVLQTSAQGFAQGLYPPVGSTLSSQLLRNGTIVAAPLNGYQIIPIQTVTGGTSSEDQAWLQGDSNCDKAVVSSNSYFDSPEYISLDNSTMAFYQSLNPIINSTINASQNSYQNAYVVYDFLNVAEIHNATIPSSDLVTNDTMMQLSSLANIHEFNLAYNASDSVRAIAGATLAAQIVQALNATVTSNGSTPINVQFGEYGQFQSFFGLANLTAAAPDFIGIPDYASTMTFELFTTVAPSPFPSADDLSVRFLWHNGTASNDSTPTPFPLFGQQNTTLSWNDFTKGMNAFAIGSQSQWCAACGNTTGVCASTGASTSPASGGASSPSSSKGGNGISTAVGGVIGAMVTLAVILGVEGIIMLIAGLRVVSKKRLSGADSSSAGSPNPKA
ncbi:hypothetical protein MMC28_010337 [Mycoblastus sanguinarius]|nr:hypothetical protein [Mycoblastus sanguinarius]